MYGGYRIPDRPTERKCMLENEFSNIILSTNWKLLKPLDILSSPRFLSKNDDFREVIFYGGESPRFK